MHVDRAHCRKIGCCGDDRPASGRSITYYYYDYSYYFYSLILKIILNIIEVVVNVVVIISSIYVFVCAFAIKYLFCKSIQIIVQHKKIHFVSIVVIMLCLPIIFASFSQARFSRGAGEDCKKNNVY